jgi:uncharacterized protein
MNFPMMLFTAEATPGKRGLPAAKPAPRRVHLLILIAFLIVSAVHGQSDADIFPPRPEPAVYVHDYSGWLDPGQEQQLEAKLRRYFDSTSTQIVVMIRPDLGDYDKSSYAFELGNRWGIGRKSKNNGVVMLIKSEPPDRGVFIATGYGVEGALPDILAGRIIREIMAPYLRQQNWYGGVDAGTDAIIAALAGEFKADPVAEISDTQALLVVGIIFLVFIVMFFFIARAIRRGTMYTNSGPVSRRSVGPRGGLGGGWWIGGGGGWGGGGGGWGGGGGFGGGGGSFGGGSFGGGGAGGDW